MNLIRNLAALAGCLADAARSWAARRAVAACPCGGEHP